MPAGKVGVSGRAAFARRASLHYGVNIRSVRQYKKSNVANIAAADIKRLRRDLRLLFTIYDIDCATAAPTVTERRKTLKKIKTSATRLVESGNPKQSWKWAGKLLEALNSSDRNTVALVYKQFSASGREIIQFKKLLLNQSVKSELPDHCLKTAKELAALDEEILAPTGGGFRDPGLAKLVAGLVPIWKVVTGRTASLISTNAEGELKKCLFAEWLTKMFGHMKLEKPPVGRVIDIVARVTV